MREFHNNGVELKSVTVPSEDLQQRLSVLSKLAVVGRLERAAVMERTMRGKRQPVRCILRNPAYAGEYWWGKSEGPRNSTSRQRSPSEWIGPIQIPAIVGPEVYNAAIERIDYNKRYSRRPRKTEYLLRGMLVCEIFGRRLAGDTSVRRAGVYTYYACTNKLAATPPSERCPAARVNGRKADEEVWNWVVSRLGDPDLVAGLLEGFGERESVQREIDDSDLRILFELQIELDREENKLIELFTSDSISLDKFRECNQALAERRNGISRSIDEIEQRQAARAGVLQDIKRARELCEAVQRGVPRLQPDLTVEEKRQVLNALHVKATARANGDIAITGFISEDIFEAVMPSDKGIMSAWPT